MSRVMGFPRDKKKYYLISTIVLLVLFGITMAQNVIRYGVYDTYNPWRSLLYLSLSLLLFIPLLPLVYNTGKRMLDKNQSKYWLWAGLSIPVYIGVYFFVSGALLMLSGFLQEAGYSQYLRQYFGKEALFHLLVLIGTYLYLWLTSEQQGPKLVSGTIGRKEVTIQAELIKWIEADDHYLKIHSDQPTLMKRLSLEKMTRELEPEFMRIHRKYLVNKEHIVGKERKQRDEYILLKSGEKLKVGRSYSPIEIS